MAKALKIKHYINVVNHCDKVSKHACQFVEKTTSNRRSCYSNDFRLQWKKFGMFAAKTIRWLTFKRQKFIFLCANFGVSETWCIDQSWDWRSKHFVLYIYMYMKSSKRDWKGMWIGVVWALGLNISQWSQKLMLTSIWRWNSYAKFGAISLLTTRALFIENADHKQLFPSSSLSIVLHANIGIYHTSVIDFFFELTGIPIKL